ncbi:fumarylacetoacetate (FAA) hydrolase [Pararhizobium capsulatum DSM 1112]|uniref:Fumarylacetoacetate (FAA) hydrolase n=1 Tax=Pararhizobium capsulatum DSM 1112 TaxID=1121113 RepID=A0ABU0BRP8_9HYPH|nr:fumarylacetoacetate hydrolase family protein [Pararhizobium capsulatum]MDQ0320923.1 fumarylacetoacetate (FAA) hydrolase [Pararhizobium capsulatum DSM 1112]
MKLATLKDSTRDGRLVVVSKDLTRCSEVGHIARTLQAALDDWAYVGPRLERVAEGVETGAQPTIRFHEHDAASPLPRAFASSLGGYFSAPRDPLNISSGEAQVEARAVVILDDFLTDADASSNGPQVALVMLAATVSANGGDTAFSPVAVTRDELENLSLHLTINGNPVSDSSKSGAGSSIDDIAIPAPNRSLGAGSIVITGLDGVQTTVRAGDTFRLESNDRTGHSIFGAIERKTASAG